MNDSQKSSRSVKVNGHNLRKLRVAAGLTQEELARNVGYSDRLIRKAELGGRVDLKTIRALCQYFLSCGHGIEMSSLTVTDAAVDGMRVLGRWFQHVYEQPDAFTAVSMLSDDCMICVDGISIGRDRMTNLLQAQNDRFSMLKLAIDYQASQGSWFVVGWTSNRQLNASGGNSNGSRLATICGITSFRVKQEKIIEIREFSDSALHIPNHLQWLAQVARQRVVTFAAN